MMDLYGTRVINAMDDRSLNKAYYFAAVNRPNPTRSSEFYHSYLTRSLIMHGLLDKNRAEMERLFAKSMEELYSSEFKRLFLFDPTRGIEDVYKTNENSITNLNVIGFFDFCCSCISLDLAKKLPLFILFDISEDDLLNNIKVPTTVTRLARDDELDETFEERVPLSDEEIKEAKKEKLIDDLNAAYKTLIERFKENVKILFENKLFDVPKLFDNLSCNHNFIKVTNVYLDIIDIFGLLAYTASIMPIISYSDKLCYTKEIIKYKKRILDSAKTIGDIESWTTIIHNFIHGVPSEMYVEDPTRCPERYMNIDMDHFYYRMIHNLERMKELFKEKEEPKTEPVVTEDNSEEEPTEVVESADDIINEFDKICVFIAGFMFMFRSRSVLHHQLTKQFISEDTLIRKYVPNYDKVVPANVLFKETIQLQ